MMSFRIAVKQLIPSSVGFLSVKPWSDYAFPQTILQYHYRAMCYQHAQMICIVHLKHTIGEHPCHMCLCALCIL